MWWYDNTMPEYALGYPEMHLHDQFGAARDIAKKFAIIFGYVFGAAATMLLLTPAWMGGPPLDFDKSSLVQQVKRSEEQKLGSRRNFIGEERTGEDGVISNEYRKSMMRNKLQAFEDKVKLKKQINAEGKNFIIKVEQEAIAAVAKRGGAAAAHHQASAIIMIWFYFDL
eukprot:TRINITY_DN1229_c0_g1_i21.p2 TRINITY_DN1229_c0_g1~~TRINITY_DN1229_c0_g1_i21.p2  ORF type:complete len:169 (-),score=53.27 TRINITY_DN1229_c0_g1_i21:188-694(-)